MNQTEEHHRVVSLTPYGFSLRFYPRLAANKAAPSRTRRERSTSTVSHVPWCVDDVDPVVSHCAVVAAEVMVIPRSCSCSSNPLKEAAFHRDFVNTAGIIYKDVQSWWFTSIDVVYSILRVFSGENSLFAIFVYPFSMFWRVCMRSKTTGNS